MRRSSNNARSIHGHTLHRARLEAEDGIMELIEELQQQIRLYLANQQSRSDLADWLALHAQELSDLPHDGHWELQADVWMLVWQLEEGTLDESAFAYQLGELLPLNSTIVRTWPPASGARERLQTASSSVTTGPLTEVGAAA
jgi:hypothetical protein